MKRKWKEGTAVFLLAGVLTCQSGCAGTESLDKKLSADKPVTVTLWNYYNGQTKTAFDELVGRFNDTLGLEKGIIVDSVSHGDVNRLAEDVYDAAVGKLGADAMPNIFVAYPDNAYRIDKLGQLVDLGQYFTEEELGEYRQAFLTDCRFGEKEELKCLPTVRSTENLFLNKTDWDEFSQATGTDLSQLSSWQGVKKAAGKYYEWTDEKTQEPGDGKALLGIDSIASYFYTASVQTGQEFFEVKGTKGKIEFDKKSAEIIWENLLVPYLSGHYAGYGRFRSDDARIGEILAYTGSSAGAAYFPEEVTLKKDQTYQIECEVLPYPYFSEEKPCAIAQGAGTSVTTSDEIHEYASCIFLKWLTETEQNMELAEEGGYMPVKTEALETMMENEPKDLGKVPVAVHSAKVTAEMMKNYGLYSNKPFEGSYEMRKFIDEFTYTYISEGIQEIQNEIKNGATYEQAVKKVTDRTHFEQWYEEFMNQAELILEQ